MKALFLLVPLLIVGCTKTETVTQTIDPPALPEFTINIDQQSGSKLNNFNVIPYYPDSIRFTWITSDTSSLITYYLYRTIPDYYGFLVTIKGNKMNKGYTWAIPQGDTPQNYFYNTQYLITRSTTDSSGFNHYEKSAYVYINRNK